MVIRQAGSAATRTVIGTTGIRLMACEALPAGLNRKPRPSCELHGGARSGESAFVVETQNEIQAPNPSRVLRLVLVRDNATLQ